MQKTASFHRIWVSLGALALVTSAALPSAHAQTPAAAAAPKAAPAAAKPAAKPTTAAKPAAAPAEPAIGPSTEQVTAARASFAAGQKAYDAGDFVTAEAEFRKAYEILPVPHAEYWIAASVDKQSKDAATVVAAYKLFLSNPSAAQVGADKVSESEARVAELSKTLPAKYLFTTTPAGAAITVDGVPRDGVTPLSTELTPGSHKIEVSLAGYETSAVEILVEGGSNVEQPLTLTELAPVAAAEPPPPAAAPAEPRSKVPAYVLLGLGGASLITGTVFGILALDAKSKYDSNPTASGADEVERNALIADMSFGLAITLGITGVVLVTAPDEAAEKPATARKGLIVAPYGGPTGGGATARLTF